MGLSADEIAVEMESLVEAVEQCFAIVVGIISETSDPGRVLRELLQAESATSLDYGPNGWRDRIARKMEIMAALKARRLQPGDEALQTLVTTVLQIQDDPEQIH